jgi:hypothetical protein
VPFANTAPLVLFIMVIVGLLLGLLSWGLLRIWRHADPEASWETPDDILVTLLALAAFALGAFVTVLVLGLH